MVRTILTLILAFWAVQITAGDIVLEPYNVFRQPNLTSCWAYSTFHSIRTYYAKNTPGFLNQQKDSWAEAVKFLNSPDRLRRFVLGVAGKGRHNPLYFLELMEYYFNLPAGPYQAFFTNPRCRQLLPGGEQGSVATSHDVTKLISHSLNNGAPAVFCNGVHCVSIYGQRNGKYSISDSLSGKFKQRSIEEVERSFCYLLVVI